MPSVEILVTAFLAVMVLASFIALKARVPYTLVLVFLGIVLAFTSALSLLGQGPIQSMFASIIEQMRSIYNQMIGGPEGGLFVGLVVPPLLFEAMLHIKSSDLRFSLKPAIILATAGVVISTLVGGFILWKIAGLGLSVSFLFASLISPTDTATVLEIFRRAKVPSKLRALMDTEAAFNDATAIVVFSVVLASISFKSVSILSALSGFALNFGIR
ncbi:MAG: cation:proton antiporter [Nitrososphaerota archaeon]|nr:cation:proton antiporter [Nitrososphaerota archaeon]